MSPPSISSEAATNLLPDPCRPTSLCSTWKFIRKYAIDSFGKKLANGSFQPDAFVSDAGSLWSKEGARLWNDAQRLAKGNQALGGTYLNWLSFKNQLDLLTETRMLRLELNDDKPNFFSTS